MYGGNRAGYRKKYGAMRRVVRRAKKGRRPSVATGGTSLRGMSTEIKCVDFPYTGVAGFAVLGAKSLVQTIVSDTNPGFNYVNAPIQGNSNSTRMGNRIVCTSIEVFGTVFPTVVAVEPTIVRIAIVYDAQPVSNGPTIGDVFCNCLGGATGATNNRQFLNMDNRLRFKIIAMKDYCLATSSIVGSSVESDSKSVFVRLRKRIRLPAFFKTNVAANDMFASGGIAVMAYIVHQGPGIATIASVDLNTRTTYIDV